MTDGAARADVLDRICARRRDDVARLRVELPLDRLVEACAERPPVHSLQAAVAARRIDGRRAVIAEFKRASPSRGTIDAARDPAGHAAAYVGGGAVAISVLTEPHEFLGRDDDLRAIRRALPQTPILRKDFTVDPWQIWESRWLGADVVLLLANVLGERLGEFLAVARAAGIEALVETHDAAELERALALPAPLIGVNARDLHTFRTDLAAAAALLGRIPADRTPIAESGIGGRADIDRLAAAGAGAFLVGETLMRSDNPAALLRSWGAGG